MLKKKKTLRRVLYIIAVLLLLVIIAAASFVIWYKSNLSAVDSLKCAGEDCPVVDFIVESGDTANSVADDLESRGLIKSALAFKIYMTLEAQNKTIMPGTYQFSKNMKVEEIVKSLNEGVLAKVFRITFLPGETLRATKQHLLDVGYTSDSIEAAFKKKYDHPLLASNKSGSLEGYIWGDTYEFYNSTPVEEILTRLFDEMWKVVKEEKLEAGYQKQGLTLHQGITLASVIQREAPADYKEKRHIAQVFLTRYKNHDALGSDAVIAYWADQQNPDRDKTDMSYLDRVTCPWNSRDRNCDLIPPHPISAPGLDALKSVANPTNTSDYYFLTGDDGKMYYAKDEAGHNANIYAHCQKLCGVL